jgi:hypothetical protein
MTAELNDDRRTLIQDAAEDAGMTVEIGEDGRDWHLAGPPASIHRFLIRVAARNSLFAGLLVDCLESGARSGRDWTWRFPAWDWGERPEEDEDDWPDIDDEDDDPAPAGATQSTEETTQS